MSVVTTLTWSCIQLQGFLESGLVTDEEKIDLIEKHLKSVEELVREPFPCFGAGWEWFNVKHPLNVHEDFQGRITIIDFFTYCCINCMHILPDLHALEEKYAAEHTGVLVVGVHSAKFQNEKVSSNILAALQRYGIHHPVVNDIEAVLWNKLEITCWPTLLVLGPDAKPIFVVIGEGHRDVLFRYVEIALRFFGGRINPRVSPILANNHEVFQSHLLFPGKICLLHFNEGGKRVSYLAISDSGHHRVLIVSLQGTIKFTIGGLMAGFDDGDFTAASFRSPQGLAFSPPNRLFVADTGNHAVRLISLDTKTVETVVGNGTQGNDKEGGKFGKDQTLASPWDLCLARSLESDEHNVLLIANAGTHQIWGLALEHVTWWKKQHLEPGQCIRLVGSGAEENRNNSYPAKAAFAQPSGISCAELPSKEYLLFVADSESSSIRQVNLKDGAVKAVVGGDRDPSNLFCFGDQDNTSEPKKPVLLQHPLAVAWNAAHNLLYVADSYNHKIKVVNPVTKICSTLAGSGKAGIADGVLGEDEIKFNEPGGLCYDADQNCLYVADTNNHAIRKIHLERKTVETVIVVPSETVRIVAEAVAADVEVTVDVAPAQLEYEWQLAFKCPDQWKWSHEAPHSWELTSYEGVASRETRGVVNDGGALIAFNLTSLCSETDTSQQREKIFEPFLQIRVELFLCATASGVCKKKSITVRLKLRLEASSLAGQIIRSDLPIILN